MARRLARRQFLGAAGTGALLGSHPRQVRQAMIAIDRSHDEERHQYHDGHQNPFVFAWQRR